MTMPEMRRWDALPIGTAAPRPHPQRLVVAPRAASCNTFRFGRAGTAGVFLDPSTATRCGRLVCTRWTPAPWRLTTCGHGARTGSDRDRSCSPDRHRTPLTGGSRLARGGVVSWRIPPGGMGQHRRHRQHQPAPRAAVALSALPRPRKRRRRWRCLADPSTRRRHPDAMILTGPAIRAALPSRRHLHRAPDRQRRRQPGRAGVGGPAPAPEATPMRDAPLRANAVRRWHVRRTVAA